MSIHRGSQVLLSPLGGALAREFELAALLQLRLFEREADVTAALVGQVAFMALLKAGQSVGSAGVKLDDSQVHRGVPFRDCLEATSAAALLLP